MKTGGLSMALIYMMRVVIARCWVIRYYHKIER